jgi:hypothetical protein
VKEVVMWVMLFCLFVGGLGAMIARFIEKTMDLSERLTGQGENTTTIQYIFWSCAGMLALGLLLLFAVYPTL